MSVESLKQKQVVIDEISEKMNRAASAVVIDYMGITVSEADAMRKKLREAGIDYKVYKNKLVSRAVEGTDFAQLKDVLAGPSAFAFSYEDPTAPARILNGVIKEYRKMEFKAGIVEGVYYDAAGIQEIANVPGREELLAKFLGSIQSPVGKFVRTLAAIAEAKPEDGAAPAEAPAADVSPEEGSAAADVPAVEGDSAPVSEAPVTEAAPEETASTEASAEEAAPAEAPAEEAAPEEASAEEPAPAEAAAPETETPAEDGATEEAPADSEKTEE